MRKASCFPDTVHVGQNISATLANTSCSLIRVIRCFQRGNFSSSKTPWRRLKDVFARHLPKKSSKCVWKTFLKTSSRRRLVNMPWRHLEDVLKTSWKKPNVKLKRSASYLQHVFNMPSPRWMFAGTFVSYGINEIHSFSFKYLCHY